MSPWRDRYIVPAGGPYLLSHSVGCLPRAAHEAIKRDFLDPWANEGGGAWTAWLDDIDRFRNAVGRLIGADASAVCPRDSVTSALFTILAGLRPDGGRNVLLVSAQAFPSIGFAMGALGRLGFQLRLIDAASDPADPETWRGAITDEVAAIVFMHVHSNSGVASPVAAIAALAREQGAWSIVDVAQSAGILPIDVAAWGADAVIGSCVKWLGGGPGTGFLWVAPDRTAAIEPIDVGWFSHAEPFAFDIADFRYADDARRFWGGTPSIAPFVLATCGIENTLAIGVEQLFALNRRLIGIAESEAGATWPMEGHGGTLCLQTDDADVAWQALEEIGCRMDRRGSIIRLSFHAVHDDGEARAVGRALQGKGARLVGR